MTSNLWFEESVTGMISRYIFRFKGFNNETNHD